MTTTAELQEFITKFGNQVDGFSRRVDTIIAENAARDAEYKEERERHDARLKEERERHDARLKEEREKRDAEYKAMLAEERRKTEEEQRKTEEAIRKVSNTFNCQWGRFVESLVHNQLLPLLRARGIPVMDTSQRRTGHYSKGTFEIDIVAHNGDTVVLVEVKTTLRPDDVKDFIETLGHAREGFTEYRDNHILGAVAFLQDTAKAAQFAQKNGLFTILATGEGAIITNPEAFSPKNW